MNFDGIHKGEEAEEYFSLCKAEVMETMYRSVTTFGVRALQLRRKCRRSLQ